MNYDEYISKIIEFNYHYSTFFALCVGLSDKGELICYRVRSKDTIKLAREIFIEDSDGNNVNFTVEYACKFGIHPKCVRRCIRACEPEFVKRINQMYCSLPPIKELIDEYKELKKQYYHTPSRESKDILHKMGQLSYEIDARQAVFLQEAKMKKTQSDRYGRFRVAPNKKGISRIYRGGGCSGK